MQSADQQSGRVRKRAPNACTQCRRQKVKCSGTVPCQQCTRRKLACTFEQGQQKVTINSGYIKHLEHEIARLRQNDRDTTFEQNASLAQHDETITELRLELPPQQGEQAVELDLNAGADVDADVDNRSDSGSNLNNDSVPAAVEPHLKNPLTATRDPGSFVFDHAGRPFYLGISSNWSFGRRVLTMVHEKVCGTSLPSSSLLFDGSTYDLGWDGRRSSAVVDTSTLPTSDFALFLINAVKFHCGQLFHMFDEPLFMQHFGKFYENPTPQHDPPILWYVHYLLILALGKAFIVRAGNGRRPPGADLYVQAMQLLPDITFLYTEPIQSVEILCCASIYLQCVDQRSAAQNLIGQAMRLAVEQGMYTDMVSKHLPDSALERYRETWWTVYVLDRQMSSLLGVPMSLSDDDITARLPSFAGSRQKSALSVHVKLAKATAVILNTVYSNRGGDGERLLLSMKEALRTIAEASDERNSTFPLDLKNSVCGVSRLTAYLHLFHHQCLILATRPLLFSFWQKRLQASGPLRVSSSQGARSLLRVCVSSAQQSLSILEALQSQCLLESFMPFDREACFSSAVVLSIAAAVDASLVRTKSPWLHIAYSALDEMVWRGSLVADYHKRELMQLDENLTKLSAASNFNSSAISAADAASGINSVTETLQKGISPVHPSPDDYLLCEWNSEDGLSGEQLLAVADSLNLEQFDWLTGGGLQDDLLTA